MSGELGSGKTVLAEQLARRRQMAFVSTGELQRSMARELGESTLALNRRAELDAEIDARVDSLSRDYAATSEPAVFDSRMAWHFVPDALRIYLVVERSVASQRLHHGRISEVEGYESAEEAELALIERFDSERGRFLTTYGVDVTRLRNYDLVVDTTFAQPEEVVGVVEAFIDNRVRPAPSEVELRIAPRRILPAEDAISVVARALDLDSGGGGEGGAIELCYDRPFFYACGDFAALSMALREDTPFIQGRLRAEADEPVAGGVVASDYLEREVRPGWVYAWEEAHSFRFLSYPRFRRA